MTEHQLIRWIDTDKFKFIFDPESNFWTAYKADETKDYSDQSRWSQVAKAEGYESLKELMNILGRSV